MPKNLLWRAVSVCGFTVFVSIRPADSYKKVCGYKNIRILADWALVWTEKCIEMLHCQTKRISVDGA